MVKQTRNRKKYIRRYRPGDYRHVSPYWTNQCRVFLLDDVMLVTLKKEPIFALTISVKVQSYLACCKPIIAVLDGEGG